MAEQPVLSFAGLLRQLRDEALLTQEELAEAASLSPRSVSDLERGISRTARKDTALLLAGALGLEGPVRERFVAAARGKAPAEDVLASRQKVAAGAFAAAATRALPRDIAAFTGRPQAGVVAAGTGENRAAGGPGRGEVVVPRQLPAGVGYFAGRGSELKALDELAGQPGDPGGPGSLVVTAVGGMAGVGKTALAVHWARTVAGRFPDGQLYVNLRGYDPDGEPVAAEAVTGWFLAALGVPAPAIPAGAQARAGLYRSVLASRRVLIVLDNARNAAQVRPLLAGGAGCLAVVTSRSSLAGLAATDDARIIPLGLLRDEEAFALLAARLGPDRLAAEPDAVGSLISACGRLPLALAIIAARAASMPGLSLAETAAQLMGAGEGRDRASELDALETGDEASSLRNVFSWSCRQLSGGAARMFRLLGLHPGPDVSVTAAVSLAGTSLRQTRQHLVELASASLITEHRPGRYVLHDLLRAYAAEQAEDTEPQAERDMAAGRAINYYLHQGYQAVLQTWPNVTLFLKAPVTALEGVAATQITSRSGAVDWFRAEQHVLPQVLAWAAGLQLDSDVVQLRMCMEGYGPISDLPAANQAMLAAALRLGDHTFIGTAYFAYGREALQRGGWDEATGHFANTLEHATLASDLNLRALAHGGLAYTADELDHVRDAIEHAQRAVALAQETGAREGEYLNSLGYYEVRAGNTEQGLAECRRAVELLRAADVASDLTVGLQLLGMSCQIAGRPAEAIAHLREAIALATESDLVDMEPRCLLWLGDALAATGDADAARDAWQHALNLYRQLAPSHPDVDKIRAKLKQAGS